MFQASYPTPGWGLNPALTAGVNVESTFRQKQLGQAQFCSVDTIIIVERNPFLRHCLHLEH